jgi:hypothetical protein
MTSAEHGNDESKFREVIADHNPKPESYSLFGVGIVGATGRSPMAARKYQIQLIF